MDECQECLRKWAGDRDREWTDVEHLVYNTNVTNKRRASKIAGTH